MCVAVANAIFELFPINCNFRLTVVL